MFEGYNPNTVDFMWGIHLNNERTWFLEHKNQYEEDLLKPTKELALELYNGLKEAYPDEPFMYKVSRIYRDARRLHGNGPYKDHLWLSIRTGDKDNWAAKPTFWFEIAPERYSFGLGFWCPLAIMMEEYRKEIDLHPEKMEEMVKNFYKQNVFSLEGEEYKKPKGNPSELLYPWYQKKNVTLIWEGPLDERIYSKSLKDDILNGYKDLMPFYYFFDHICAKIPQENFN